MDDSHVSSGIRTPSGLTDAWRMHRLPIALFFLMIVVRLPFLAHADSLLLMGQDFNARHFSLLYANDDIPAFDDSEVGPNARRFVFSTLYFWGQHFANRLGVPFETFTAMHMVLVAPLLVAGLYMLAFSIWRDPLFAVFFSLLFYAIDGIGRIQIGYWLAVDSVVYYGDFNHVLAVFFLAAIIRRRLIAAGVLMAILLLFNPTYGVNGLLLLFPFLAWMAWRGTRRTSLFYSGAIACVGLAVSYLLVRYAAGEGMPVAPVVRNFSIRSYSHFAPHVLGPRRFWLSMLICLLVLAVSAIVGRSRYAERCFNLVTPWMRVFLPLLFVLVLFWGLGAYFLLYVYSPPLFVMCSPSKIMFFVSFMVVLLIARGLYLFLAFLSSRALPSFVRGLFFLLILLFGIPYWLIPTEGRIVAALKTLAGRDLDYRATLWYALPLLGGYLLFAVFMERKGAMATATRLPVWQRLFPAVRAQSHRLFNWVVVFGLIFLTAGLPLRYLAKPAYGYIDSFREIQDEIRLNLPRHAIIVPYRVSGAKNPFGPFWNFPFRTYARRGGLTFWILGRNAYFNNRTRLAHELRGYRAAGIDVWRDMLAEAKAAHARDPVLYYTGISLSPFFVKSGRTPPFRILDETTKRLRTRIEKMTFREFLRYAGAVGATHVLVCTDRDTGWGEIVPVLANDRFGVVAVPTAWRDPLQIPPEDLAP